MGIRMGKTSAWVFLIVLIVFIGGATAATSRHWLPWAKGQLQVWLAEGASAEQGSSDDHDDEEAHGHDHEEDSSIELSPSGLKNIGYRPLSISVGTFTRTVMIPGMVVERPGRSQIHITAPLTGILTKISATQGAAVESGSPLFTVRLTHEELVVSQRDFIRTAQSLDVVRKEISRLESLTDGVVPGRRVLEKEYEQQQLEAALKAERQALLMHGLAEEHIQALLDERQLLTSLNVRAPPHSEEHQACHTDHLFHVQRLPVNPGEHVKAGQVLCVLGDHCELNIEGRAFADDADQLREAARQGWTVLASWETGDGGHHSIEGLKLLYLDNHIDPENRAFRFYLSLPNDVVLDQQDASGQRFIEWRFKPGQRMHLYVPVELWDECIVLPVEAVVEEGAESFVYRQDGDHFNRTPVTVVHRDHESVVIANDGSVFPGDIVAGRGAYQMHLAIKNQSGGGVDPHHGHTH